MRYLFIAEKPSVMNAVKDTYRKYQSEVVNRVGELEFVALSGHVCRFLDPNEYPQWKDLKWDERDLPMIPDPFVITKISEPAKAKCIANVKEILKEKKPDGIIVATDSDVEGNGIYYLLSEYLKLQNYKTLRFFEQSLTDKEILSSLYQMTDFYRNPRDIQMTEAYLVRAHRDWLIGMNATTALTVKTGELKRIGSVKAPTMKIIYTVCKAIDEFVPHSDYLARVHYREGFSGFYVGADGPVTYATQEEAEQFLNSIASAQTALVKSIERKSVQTPAPKLYKLSTIQKDAGAAFNYPPDKTLSIIQSLYEKKYVSYPRTNGEYVSSEKAMQFPQILKAASSVPELAPFIARIGAQEIKRVQNDKHVVNDKEVQKESHDALMPTENAPEFNKLPADEQNIYSLIARRLVAEFMFPLKEEKTVLMADVAGYPFKSNGTVTTEKGWTELYNRKGKGEAIPSDLRQGSQLSIDQKDVYEKKSTPPKRLTLATLVDAMEHIAKYIGDKHLKQVMNEAKGIGQPSTRAKIINDLMTTGYIETKTKANQIYITDMGKRYVESISKFTISDPIQAAEWEMSLQMVREGTKTFPEAEEETRTYIKDFVREVDGMELEKVANGGRGATVMEGESCPYCGKRILKLKWGYACEDSRENCNFKVSNANGKLKDKDLHDLIHTGSTKLLKKVIKGQYDAYIKLQPKGSQYATGFAFEEKPKTEKSETSLKCPWCGKPIIQFSWGYACEDSKKGCNFSVSGHDGKVTEQDMKDLIHNGKTGLIHSIAKSKKTGKPFDAILKLQPKGSQYATIMEFPERTS